MRVILTKFVKKGNSIEEQVVYDGYVDKVRIEELKTDISFHFKAELKKGIIPYYELEIAKSPEEIAMDILLKEIKKFYEQKRKEAIREGVLR